MGYVARRTHPQATTAMVLGILSLVVCGIFTAIPAIVIGNRVQREVRASRGTLEGESSAKVGIVCGWVSVGFTAIGLLALVAVIMLGSTVEPEPQFQQIQPPVIEFESEFPPASEREAPRQNEFVPTTTSTTIG